MSTGSEVIGPACNYVHQTEAYEGRVPKKSIYRPSIAGRNALNNLLSAFLANVSAVGADSGRRPHRFILLFISSIRSVSFDWANPHQSGGDLIYMYIALV